MKKIVLACGLAASFLLVAGCAKNTLEQSAQTNAASAPAGHDYKGEASTKK